MKKLTEAQEQFAADATGRNIGISINENDDFSAKVEIKGVKKNDKVTFQVFIAGADKEVYAESQPISAEPFAKMNLKWNKLLESIKKVVEEL